MRLFEITAPNGSIYRQWAISPNAMGALKPGYKVTGEVLGANWNGFGGIVDPIGPGTKSILQMMLETRGRNEMLFWITTHPQLLDGMAVRAP